VAPPKRAASWRPVYEWFTEGFYTTDLIAAKALLTGLGTTGRP
jgi:hypothetical protein